MASMQTLGATVLMILMIVVVGAISVKIVADVGSLIDNSQAQDVANQGLSAINVIFQWLPLVAVVVVAAVILVLLVRGLAGSFFGGGKE